MTETSTGHGERPAEELAGTHPDSATNAEEYVAQLRRIRAASGLTFRQIESKARAAGLHLPSSTLATALSRGGLPREEIVVALVTVCGGAGVSVSEWVTHRRRLAAADSERRPSRKESDAWEREDRTSDVEPAGRVRRWRVPLVGAAVIALIVAGVAIAITATTDKPPSRSPNEGSAGVTYPANGPYLIRAVRSGLCLSERPVGGDGSLFQAPCAEAFPPMALRALGGATFRIETTHPEHGPGCMGVPDASTVEGVPIGDDYCTEPDAKVFRLEPSTSPAEFRLIATHSELCVAVPAGELEPWAPVLQLACEPAHDGQLFAFESR